MKKVLPLLLVAAFSSPLIAQQNFTSVQSGPSEGIPAGGSFVPPGGLYDNEQSNGSTSLASQDSSGTFTARSADDFVITATCASGLFDITEIRAQMVQQNAAPQAFAIDLFDDNGMGTFPQSGINPIATVAETSQTLLGAFGTTTSIFEASFVPVGLQLSANTVYWISGYGADSSANAAGFNNFFAVSNGATGTTDNGAIIAPDAGVDDWTATDLVVAPPRHAYAFAIDGVCVVQDADVSVTKAATAPAAPVVGDTVTFSLTASNAGPADAENVVVTDVLPVNLTYVSNSCGAAFAAGTVTWTIGTLTNGATQNCDIATTINNFGPISNTATIASTTTDPNATNDSSTVALAGAPFPADVAITIGAAPAGGLAVGDTFVYTVTGTNNGPGDAAGVLFNLTLSSKVSFVSSDCGAVLNGNVVSWSEPTLANGASTACQVTVAVVLGGDISSSATVSTTTVDPNLTNNSAAITVGFEPLPVPTLDRLGLLLAGLLVIGLGLVAVRRF